MRVIGSTYNIRSLPNSNLKQNVSASLMHQPYPFFSAIEKWISLCNALEHLESLGTKVRIICKLYVGGGRHILEDFFSYFLCAAS